MWKHEPDTGEEEDIFPEVMWTEDDEYYDDLVFFVGKKISVDKEVDLRLTNKAFAHGSCLKAIDERRWKSEYPAPKGKYETFQRCED